MRFGAAWNADFRKGMAAPAKAARIAATKGVRLTIDGAGGFKQGMRAMIRGAGLGDKVANALRSIVYPKGSAVSLHPAGVVFSKAPHIMEAFTKGAVIRPVNGGRFIWIPTKDCPRGSRRRFLKPEECDRRFGKPRFSRLPNGNLLASYPQVEAKAGGFRKSNRGRSRQGRKAVYVAFFTLVPSARLPRKLNPAAELAKAGARLNANIAASWPQKIEALE